MLKQIFDLVCSGNEDSIVLGNTLYKSLYNKLSDAKFHLYNLLDTCNLNWKSELPRFYNGRYTGNNDDKEWVFEGKLMLGIFDIRIKLNISNTNSCVVRCSIGYPVVGINYSYRDNYEYCVRFFDSPRTKIKHEVRRFIWKHIKHLFI